MSSNQQPKPYQKHGNTYHDTTTIDYSDLCKINFASNSLKYKPHRVVVYQDGKYLYGLQVFHLTDKQSNPLTVQTCYGRHSKGLFTSQFELDSDEFIVQIDGRCGAWFDNLTFTTSKGKVHSFGGFGGQQFTVKASAGKQLTIPEFGFGGHLHYISFAELPIWTDSAKYCEEIKLQKGEKVFFGGKTNLDTQISHPLTLNSGAWGQTNRIKRLQAWCDGSIYDLTATYSFNDGTPISLDVTKGWAGSKSKQITYDLETDEVIVQVDGGTNDYMHYLSFKTNKGRNLEFGSMEKAKNSFKWVADPGFHLSLFRPGIGGHLHTLECWQLPISAPMED